MISCGQKLFVSPYDAGANRRFNLLKQAHMCYENMKM